MGNNPQQLTPSVLHAAADQIDASWRQDNANRKVPGMFQFIEKSLTTGKTREFEAPPFPAETKAIFADFVAITKVLNDTALIRNWSQYDLSIHFGNDGRVRNCGKLPSDDEIAVFLHRMRPIYLENEPTNFHRIAKKISTHFKDPWVTMLIREAKRHYDGRASREVFTMMASGMVINSQEFLDHYLNALEYHREPERRKHIDRVAEGLPLDVQKNYVVLLLVIRLNVMNKLASFLGTCFARENGEAITLESP